MAKEPQKQDQAGKEPEAQAGAPAPKGLFSNKLVKFGMPVLVAQVALVYFLIAKFVVPSNGHAGQPTPAVEHKEAEGAGQQHLYVVKDIIVNPAGTNGARFLLTTVGLEVSTPEAAAELQTKDMQVRDLLISILTSRPLDELVDIQWRDSIRSEITKKSGEMLKSGKMKNVYFSKFVIQ